MSEQPPGIEYELQVEASGEVIPGPDPAKAKDDKENAG